MHPVLDHFSGGSISRLRSLALIGLRHNIRRRILDLEALRPLTKLTRNLLLNASQFQNPEMIYSSEG